MSMTNQKYIDAQLLQYAPMPHEAGANGQCTIVLRSGRGRTNYITIDALCALGIEQALRSMAERKDREGV